MSNIVVAPFSNSDIRDWPAERFSAMIGRLVDQWNHPGKIRVIGTGNQAIRARDIVRAHDPDRVTNDCGRLEWDEVLVEIERAACVIGNNSGITHYAAAHDVPTVCVFSGAHQRIEWRPIGASARVLTRTIGCAPCGLHRARDCPYDLQCLQQIEPELVADTALDLMRAREGVA